MSPESLYPFVRAQHADRARNAFVVLMAALLAATSMLVWSAAAPRAALASGEPFQLAFTVEPADGTADDEFDVTVEIQDEGGLAVSGNADTVNLTLIGGGTLEGTASVAAVDGEATFTGLAVRLAGTGYTLTASSGSLGDATSAAFDIGPGAPSGAQSTITASTASVSVDDSSPTVTVQAIDAYDNVITTGGADVELSSDQDGALIVTDNDDGTYSAVVVDTVAPVTHVVSGSIDTNEITTGDATIDFTPGAPSVDTTTIDAAPPTVSVDIHLSDITVHAKDQFGNDVGEGGADVGLSSDGGTISTVTDVGDGTYTATLEDTVTRLDTVSGTLGESDIDDTATVDFTPGALHHFGFAVIPDQVAGDEFTVVVTAYDQYNNVKTNYDTDGDDAELGSNLGTSPAPTNEAADLVLSAFVNGEATATVTAYLATAGRHLTIEDDGKTGQSNDFTVAPGPLGSFAFESVDDQIAGTEFTVDVTAYDIYSNVKTDYAGGAVLGHDLGTSPAPSSTAPSASLGSFSGGTATATVTAYRAESGRHLTIDDADEEVDGTSDDFTVAPGPLGSFSLGSVTSPRTAGVGFPFSATAYDIYSNVKTNYTGGAVLSSTFVASPFGDAPDVPAVTWGSGTGTGSATVTTFASALTANQSLTLTDELVNKTTNQFAVNPAALSSLEFSATGSDPDAGFNGQPIDTKTGQPIYSVCVPTGATGSNPCGTASANSTGVKVLARDAYGNRVLPTSIALRRDNSGTTWNATTANGIADFLNQPSISALGNSKLRASSGSVVRLSDEFRIVDNLQACDGALCANQFSGNGVRSYGKIVTTGDFYDPGNTNVIMTTSIVPSSQLAGRCSTNPFTDGSDLRVQGLLGATAPTTDMVLVVPKNVLKTVNSRGVPHFNVCLGALWIGAPSPTAWTGKSASGSLVPTINSDAADPLRYWGVPADCGTAGLSSTDPCIALRTKQASDVKNYLGLTSAQVASFMKDSDLAIIIRKPFPWDGKGGVW